MISPMFTIGKITCYAILDLDPSVFAISRFLYDASGIGLMPHCNIDLFLTDSCTNEE